MEQRLISFVSVKGGVGKSTHTAALAAGLLDKGFTVHVVDTDPQGTSEDWASGAEEYHEQLLSSFLDLKEATFNKAQDEILGAVDRGAQYTILDTPGVAESGTSAALFAADLVLSPFALSEPDITGLKRTHDLFAQVLRKFGEGDTPDNFLGLFVGEPSFLSKADLDEMKELNRKFRIGKGLRRSPHIKNWMGSCRTPLQLKEGVERATGSRALTETALEKASDAINQFADNVIGVFEDA